MLDASLVPSFVERVESIDRLLPQTQCTLCGYAGCRPYAEAIAEGQAEINQCPPGGAQSIKALAALLGRAELPLNPAHGIEENLQLAWIEEEHCIGCTLCIQACPVDAIVGAAKQMHTVITELCTGCKLCIAPCPVDCIRLVPSSFTWTRERGMAARQRHQKHALRLTKEALPKETPTGNKIANAQVPTAGNATISTSAMLGAQLRKRKIIESAMARARHLQVNLQSRTVVAAVPDVLPEPVSTDSMEESR